MTHDGLRDLQESFQAHLLYGDDGMLGQISADARPSAAARLAIYANAYRLRLLEALTTDFPALHTLAGDALFEQLGRAYIDAHPSTHFSIRYFGGHLSAFLGTAAPWCETPVLSEMATLEWALTLAFDAADDPLLDEAALAALPPAAWPGMRLRWHASVQRHDFRWNVPELWSAIDQQRAPEPPTAYSQLRPWLIWRRALQNYFRPLDDTEAWALDCLRAGADFATACTGLCERVEPSQVSTLAAGYLKGWVRAGLVAGIYW
jgi:hypothetical protein